MKKLLSYILSIMFVLTMSPLCVHAAEGEAVTEVISFDEYYNSMKELYSEYNIDYEILDVDEDFVFTRELLERQLLETREMLENSANSASVHIVASETADQDKTKGDDSVRALMPYSYQDSCYVYLTNPSILGYAYFKMTLNATADAQHNTFLSINSYTFRQSGEYMNFKSWTELSKSYVLSSDRQKCTVTFVGEIVFEYTEPNTGITAGYTSTHEIEHTFSVV